MLTFSPRLQCYKYAQQPSEFNCGSFSFGKWFDQRKKQIGKLFGDVM